jgi:hypothetical protein
LLGLGGELGLAEAWPAGNGEGGGVSRIGHALPHGERAAVVDGDADAEHQRDEGEAEQDGHVAAAVARERADLGRVTHDLTPTLD